MKGGLGRALKGHGFELVKDRLGYSAPNTVNNVISESQVLLGYFLSLCNHFLIHLVLNIYILMALKCVEVCSSTWTRALRSVIIVSLQSFNRNYFC